MSYTLRIIISVSPDDNSGRGEIDQNSVNSFLYHAEALSGIVPGERRALKNESNYIIGFVTLEEDTE